MIKWIIGYAVVINIITFLYFFYDKRQAQQGKWRVPEKRLLLLCFLGGAAGGWQGMRNFRHKVHNQKFRWLIPFFMVLHVVVLGYLGYQLV
jgi:uncharacterized membrane protein YsdA (DUF1294 family)